MTQLPTAWPERGAPEDAGFERLGRLVRAAASTALDPIQGLEGRSRFVTRAAAMSQQPRRLRLLVTTLATAGAAVAAGALLWNARELHRAVPASVAVAPGVPALSDPTPSVEGAPLPGGTHLQFADGSDIQLDAEASGRLAETSPSGARIVLHEGGLRAQVTPRTGAHWRVEAGPFAVRVTGTIFDVRWRRQEQRFEVRLERGSVVIEGPRFVQPLTAGHYLAATVDAGIVALGPLPGGESGSETSKTSDEADEARGESVRPARTGNRQVRNTRTLALADGRVNEAARSPRRTAPVTSDDSVTGGSVIGRSIEARDTSPVDLDRLAPPSEAPRKPAPPRDAGDGKAGWSRLVRAGAFRQVVSEARTAGLEGTLSGRGLDDLDALATASRLAGQRDLARRALQALRDRFPGAPAAREAAFQLGRMAEDDDRDPRGAVDWYDRYLDEAPHGPLAVEALGRKLTTLAGARAADGRPRRETLDTARVYLQRYPRGPHAALARALLDRP